MKQEHVAIIGGGAREHAFMKAIQKPGIQTHCIPGNAGTKIDGAINVPLDPTNADAVVSYITAHKIETVLVGPEAPLASGVTDVLNENWVDFVFGPSQSAARIETDKAWAVEFMKRHDIPHPASHSFSRYEDALNYVVQTWDTQPCVIKVAGLASGKGVILPHTLQEAQTALWHIMIDKKFGSAGGKIVIQERISGPEVSVMVFTDGIHIALMPTAQDHKELYPGGPMTGGMGAYAPVPFVDELLLENITTSIMQKTIDGMRAENNVFQGILFAGIMLTDKGPMVLEFNARAGDPEWPTIAQLLNTDLLTVARACTNGTLDTVAVQFKKEYAASVILAADGYPSDYTKGARIHGIEKTAEKNKYVTVYHAGTTHNEQGELITSGGRVLAVRGRGRRLDTALKHAYEAIGEKRIHFDHMVYRDDIGAQGVKPKK